MFDTTDHQNFYLEHSDDIICLAVNEHPKFKNIVATGQIGAMPEVNIWNASTRETLSVIKVCVIPFALGSYVMLCLERTFSKMIYLVHSSKHITSDICFNFDRVSTRKECAVLTFHVVANFC